MDSDSREAVVQNLKDAGCSKPVIKNFLSYFDQGKTDQQMNLLETHRDQLLNKVHKEERKIFCLDYLICKLKK